MTDNLFPADMHFADRPDQEWKNLDEQTVAARMKRVDLSYYMHLQEITRGKSGWIERVVQGLAIQEGEAKRAKQVIADNVKVFKLFRVPEEQGGLGFTRDQLGQHSFRQLRAFAQNKDWSAQNKHRIPALLADPTLGEESIRELIKTEKGETVKTGATDYDRMRFDFTSQDGEMIDEILAAMTRRRHHAGHPFTPSQDDGRKPNPYYERGKVLSAIFADWLMADSGLEDEHGYAIPNMAFFKGGAYAQDEGGEDDVSAPSEAQGAA